jgi:uncharacterized protein (UPF0332 family)
LATWEELSRENLRAAKLLAEQGYLRSSISRAYYAAYCAVAGELAARGLSFPHGWKNPSHEQLPQTIAANLPLPLMVHRRMNRSIRLLRGMREDADYRPNRHGACGCAPARSQRSCSSITRRWPMWNSS